MIYDFCFIVISYNQENYVYEHLESIKYQIINYGSNYKIQIIFSDDASKDNTVLYAQKWIETNSYLFDDICILKREKNVGTVKNIINAINYVKAFNYKMTACDDVYYKNSIFEIQGKADIVLTPTILFSDNGTIYHKISIHFSKLLATPPKKLKEKIRKSLKYAQIIQTPGAFVKIKFWQDKELQNFVEQYVFIEDIPFYYYVFHHFKSNFSVAIDSTPYILYRYGVGISNRINSNVPNVVDLEYRRIRKKIPAREEVFPKYINPFRYWNALEQLYYKSVKLKHNKKLIKFQEDYLSNIEETKKYLSVIKKNAEIYKTER